MVRFALHLQFICLVLFLSACRQDEDVIPPQVVLTQPTGTIPTYDFGEALGLSFTANDEGGIERWSVRLTDQQGVRRFSTPYQSVAEGTLTLNMNYTIDLGDVHWPTGDYTLGIFVVDQAGNEGAAFKTIRYNEAPLRRERIVVIRTIGNNSFALDSLAGDGTLYPAQAINGDFNTVLAGSYHGEVVIGGALSPELSFFDRNDLSIQGSYTSQNPLNGVFVRNIVYHAESRNYFVSFFDGFIREFGAQGQLKSSFAVPDGFRPEALAVQGNYVVAALRQIGGNGYLIASFHRNSGILAASNAFPPTIAAFLPYNDQLLVLANVNGSSQAYLLDLASMNYNAVPWLISDTPVAAAWPLDNGFSAVAHADGVWMYRFGTGTFVPGSENGVQASQIDYDPVAQHIFAVSNNTLHRISRTSGQLISSLPINGLARVAIVMNK